MLFGPVAKWEHAVLIRYCSAVACSVFRGTVSNRTMVHAVFIRHRRKERRHVTLVLFAKRTGDIQCLPSGSVEKEMGGMQRLFDAVEKNGGMYSAFREENGWHAVFLRHC